MPTAQVVTITENTFGSIKRIVWDWACTDGGAVVGSVTTAVFDGEILALVTVPDGGADAPTDNYDITIKDANGVDLLAGQGANRHTSNTEYVTSGFIPVAMSKLTLAVANAGDANKGTVYLYIR